MQGVTRSILQKQQQQHQIQRHCYCQLEVSYATSIPEQFGRSTEEIPDECSPPLIFFYVLFSYVVALSFEFSFDPNRFVVFPTEKRSSFLEFRFRQGKIEMSCELLV